MSSFADTVVPADRDLLNKLEFEMAKLCVQEKAYELGSMLRGQMT